MPKYLIVASRVSRNTEQAAVEVEATSPEHALQVAIDAVEENPDNYNWIFYDGSDTYDYEYSTPRELKE